MRLVGSIDQQRFSARFAEARAAKGLSNAEIGDAVPPRRFSMVRVTRSRTGRTMPPPERTGAVCLLAVRVDLGEDAPREVGVLPADRSVAERGADEA